MGAVTLWVRAEWRRSIGSLLALAALLGLAGGVVLALAAGARRADTSIDRFAESVGLPDLTLAAPLAAVSDDIGAFNRHLSLVDQAAELEGVESVVVDTWWAMIPSDQVAPGRPVAPFVVGVSAVNGQMPVHVVRGELPGPDQEALVVNEEAERAGYGLGTSVELRSVSAEHFAEWAGADASLPDDSLLDGPTTRVAVVAVVRVVDDIADERFPVMVVTPGFEKAHATEIAHCNCFVSVRTNGVDPEGVGKELERLYAPYQMQVVPTTDVASAARLAIAVEVTTLRIATLVASAAALLLVGQAFARAIARVAAPNSTRRAIGMTTNALVLGTAAVTAPALALGGVGAVLLATALSGAFPVGLAALAEIEPGARLDPRTFLVGLPLLLLTGVLLVVLLAWRASRPRAVAVTTTSLLVPAWLRRPSPTLGASFALDPLGGGARSRFVAAMTASTVAVAVAAFLAVATLSSSTDELQKTPHLFGASGELLFGANGNAGVDEALEVARAEADVASITEYTLVDADTTGELVATRNGVSIPVVPATYRSERGDGLPAVRSGSLPDSDDEVALGERTASDLSVDIGEQVSLVTDDGRRLDLVVTGVVVAWGPDSPDTAFLVTSETLMSAACTTAAGECDLVRFVFASTEDDVTRASLLDAGFGPVPVPGNVARLDQVGAIPWYLAGFLGLFGLAGVAHALASSSRRRRSDIAIVRALGLTSGGAARSLTWQAVMVSMLGLLAGLVLGVVAGRAIWKVVADALGVLYRPILPAIATPTIAAAALAGALLVSLIPSARARRLRPADQLRSE